MTCWRGMTEWLDYTVTRISVSSWATTADGVERSLTTTLAAADRKDLA